VILGALACLAACVGDFLFTFLLGSRYPDYNQITDVMSLLGTSGSPVSHIISLWWIILGFLIIIFAVSFRITFSSPGIYPTISFWLLVTYGAGEGIGSALFKADVAEISMTSSYVFHDIFSGAGVLAILILPLSVARISPFSMSIIFRRFSWLVFISGTLLLILFTFRFTGSVSTFPVKYTGLWQRLFVFQSYIYLLVIASVMARRALFPKAGSVD